MYKRAPSRKKRSIFDSSGDRIHRQFTFRLPDDFELMFRLSIPEGEGSLWKLEYFMQSKSDPSLIYDLDTVMRGKRERSWVQGRLDLVAIQRLGAASKVTGFVPASFEQPGPRELGPEEAYRFMTEDAGRLDKDGFQVQVPNLLGDPVRPSVVMRLKRPSHTIGSGLDASAVLEFDYQVALGDIVMDPDEFMTLAARKEHLVQVRGKWMEFRPEEVERLSQMILEGGERATLPEALSLSIRAAEDGIETLYESEGRSTQDFLDAVRTDRRFSSSEAPSGFEGVLRPYQERGVGWLHFITGLGFGALLADDMGLGKTVQIIAFALECVGRGRRPFLIVCPTSVIGNWAAEIGRFAPSLDVTVHHGGDRQEGDDFKRRTLKSDMVITSYALAWRDAEEFRSVRWAAIVVDEAQNIKNPFAKQSAFLRQLKGDLRIALTGTPIENRLSDLWSIMDFLNPGYLPPWPRFNKVFARPIEAKRDPRMTRALVKAMSPVLLRRMKTDRSIISDLPDKIEDTEWCHLTPEQATLYKAQVEASLREIQEDRDGKRRMQILATITRLKQICNHPANFLKDSTELADRSGKVGRLRELVGHMAANGESCLVFTQYAEMGSLLCEDLKKEIRAPVSFIHGGVRRKERDRIISEFQGGEACEPAVLVLSLKAGGTGLNLTRATNVIHFDRWWNPAVEDQATDRTFRIGQRRNVMVFKFVTKGTIEERIEKILEDKRTLAESIIGSGEGLLAGLDTDRLRELMEYREP